MKTLAQSMILVVFIILLWGCNPKEAVSGAGSGEVISGGVAGPDWSLEKMQSIIDIWRQSEFPGNGDQPKLMGWRDNEVGRILYFNYNSEPQSLDLIKVETPQGLKYSYADLNGWHYVE